MSSTTSDEREGDGPASDGPDSAEREVRESLHRVFLAGLGALAVAEEEGTKIFRHLVDRGSAFRERYRDDVEDFGRRVTEEASKVRERAGSTLSKLEAALEEAIAERVRRTGAPSEAEVAELVKRIEELTRQVEDLRARRGKSPGGGKGE